MTVVFPRMLLLMLLFALEGLAAFQLAEASKDGSMAAKILMLWVLAGGFHFLGMTVLARFALAMVLTALFAPLYLAHEQVMGPLSQSNWALLATAALLCWHWLDWDPTRQGAVFASSRLMALFLCVPVLLVFQLAPLLGEVYSQSILVTARGFLSIPFAFAVLLLGFSLRPSPTLLAALGAPLALAAVKGFLP